MNSEELELSLRTEFESYLKSTIAEMKQEVSEFQQEIESEFEKHKSHLDEVVQEFSEKFGDEKKLEDSFRDSVTEHLKLAREEGSKITADAFAEAEQLREEEAAQAEKDSDSSVEYADIRDAISEISSKESQSEILKSLVHHATQWTPRGAFFIVKNEHLVGWRIFGTEEHPNPQLVREVFFPVSSKTALSESIESLATITGSNDTHEDNLLYLSKLDFEQPDKMYAIPLVARGRGVAVLYADNGKEGGNVNVEVLETLMRVAGLTVEVLASTQIAKNQASEAHAFADVREEESKEGDQSESEDYSQTKYAQESVEQPETAEFEQADFSTDYAATDDEEATISEFDFQPVEESTEPALDKSSLEEVEVSEDSEEPVAYEDSAWQDPSGEPVQDFSVAETVEEDDLSTSVEEEDYSVSFDSDESMAFDSAESADSMSFESSEDSVSSDQDYEAERDQTQQETVEFESSQETPQFESFNDTSVDDSAEEVSETLKDSPYEFESSDTTDFDSGSEPKSVETEDYQQEFVADKAQTVERPVSVSTPPVRTRFGDRNVDLPIEVAEDERRLHNDARRFARLLVSEIKLYNEQKVKEGRESSDLYERLREAIDRSREMYDKRVQPPVAAKFDYFNYELINTLADGEENKLGGSYPGATI